MCSLKHEAKCRVPSSVAEEAAEKGNLLKSAGKKLDMIQRFVSG